MAKSGAPSSASAQGSDRSAATKRQLVDAAIQTLKIDGYAGASARAIARRAGVNQGLIFYHFSSVANLLLAALDSVSAERLDRYEAEVSGVTSPSQLVEVAEAIFRSDLDAGYITVLVEMIAGTSSTPGLGPEVAARIQPWRSFAVLDRGGPGRVLVDQRPAGPRHRPCRRRALSRFRDAEPPRG
jgi:AcrR family transcriptional regulator